MQSAPSSSPSDQVAVPDLPATPLRFVLYFVSRYRRWYLAMLALETINAGCGILIPYALGAIIKSVGASQGQAMPQVVDALQPSLLLFVALSVGEVVFGRLAGAIQIRLGPRLRQQVTRTIYHYLQHHSYRYLTSNFAGALAHRINETAAGVALTVWSVLTEFWPTAVVLTVATALLFHAHLQLGVFVLGWTVLFVILSYLLARRCRPYALRAAAARSETTGAIVDSVTNLTSARLFARLGFERDNLERNLKRELSEIHLSNGYAERVRWFQFGAAAVLKVSLLYFALTLWQQGLIGVGEFVMVASLSLLVISEARNLSRRFLDFFEYIGNVSNGVNTIVQPHEVVDRPGAQAVHLKRGHIRFNDVRFGYNPATPVFDGLNVDIPAGQRVGLVGLSGSGKSTFVSLVLRLYDPQGGSIQIDRHDIRALTQDSLHSQISLIPQDPSLFHRSLMENIRYGRVQATEAEVAEAARLAHAHEFIERIPEGYQALVGERGIKLSGGQRQRIAIARVILKDAPILILDEATSALDSITEQAIQDTLDEVMRGKTVIVVAHRLSTIAHLDRILVFEDGRVVEDGPHAKLVAQHGAYWRLWSRQAGGFLPEGPGATKDTALAANAAGDVAMATSGEVTEAHSLQDAEDRPPFQSTL